MATHTIQNTTAGDFSVGGLSGETYTISSAPFYQPSCAVYDNNLAMGENINICVKKLENRIIQLETDNSAQKMKIVEMEAAKFYNKNGTNKEWYDVISMLNDMHAAAHFGNNIITCDNIAERKYGFVGAVDGTIWEINMNVVKNSKSQMYIKNGRAILVPDAFYSIEGRSLLLDVINGE